MRLWKLLLLAPLLMLGLAATAPSAFAGGWAMTFLDPVPERFEAGKSYTLGYWVLQHGSHPFDESDGGSLGVTGLRVDGPNGKRLTFEGVNLPEPGHYAVAIAIPGKGTWRVSAMQGIFEDVQIGTLTVPGALKVRPHDVEPMHVHGDGNTERPWGAIHPPGLDAAAPSAHRHSAPTDAQPAAESQRVPADGPPWPLFVLLALGAATVAGGAVLLARRRRTE